MLPTEDLSAIRREAQELEAKGVGTSDMEALRDLLGVLAQQTKFHHLVGDESSNETLPAIESEEERERVGIELLEEDRHAEVQLARAALLEARCEFQQAKDFALQGRQAKRKHSEEELASDAEIEDEETVQQSF